ncbi:MAG: exo-beta-1 3-glucanase [Gammaproteobacteria bacterium]|nr:MAG: exo-beta-1 3-glucanase [Gammaproteobacteria bacterium]TND02250.1 MAG: exo-beta-1,3-glucanase [Gammaproteobacteria bacterium]
MNKSNIVLACLIVVVTTSLWAYFNQPQSEPAWPKIIQGFSFMPMRAHHDPVAGLLPNVAEIEDDLKLLSGKAHAVRTYTVEQSFGEIPRLAQNYQLNVALGGWVGADLGKNEQEIEKLISVVHANPRNVVRVIVGNEAILRNDVPIEQVIQYLDRVRGSVEAPVSTAEPWHIWLKYPELVDHVDYIAVHMLPYWEGVDVESAGDYVVRRMNELKTAFPDKPIVIAEVGWPSNGRTRQAAVASVANEATFLRRFLDRAHQENYVYYIMEAFDQQWKQQTEGSVGAYWGVYNVDRNLKFEMSSPVITIPEWRTLAGLSAIIAATIFTFLLLDSRSLDNRGRAFLAAVATAAATSAVWICYEYTRQYPTVTMIVVGIVMAFGMIGVVAFLLIEAHEWAEALWVKNRRRNLVPVVCADHQMPMVSVHVPAYNEPSAMLIKTLDALARINYPRFEVIVIDNNTKDPNVWQPVEQHCRFLGPRFRFFHEDTLAGFKAGALNYALRRTDPRAEVVAVIDSDYVVESDWLRELATQFVHPKIAIVQAPQDYRDGEDSLFKEMAYAEYRGFFHIGMVTRNERNAIIQHGTMTMVRRSILESIGGWGEWCITEDAELGLRIFAAGHDAIYVPQSYGRGLIPDSFGDYKKQRFRWAYGSIQIMRRHARALFGAGTLTAGQRYHFLAGWFPWIADGLNLIFTVGAIAWSLAMIIAPEKVDPPLILFTLLPLTLFLFRGIKLVYLYRMSRIVATTRQTIGAALAGLSLSHTIAKASLQGMFTSNKPFFRTPKLASGPTFFRALVTAWDEMFLMMVLWAVLGGVVYRHGWGALDLELWIATLTVQSVPYAAAVVMSLISSLARSRRQPVTPSTDVAPADDTSDDLRKAA